MKRPMVTTMFSSPLVADSGPISKEWTTTKDRENRPSACNLDQDEAGAQAMMRQNPGGNPQGTRYRYKHCSACLREEAPSR